jgi:hypothetical protein
MEKPVAEIELGTPPSGQESNSKLEDMSHKMADVTMSEAV